MRDYLRAVDFPHAAGKVIALHYDGGKSNRELIHQLGLAKRVS